MKSGVAVDLRYTNNCSFGLDMKILGLNCIEVVRKRKASWQHRSRLAIADTDISSGAPSL